MKKNYLLILFCGMGVMSSCIKDDIPENNEIELQELTAVYESSENEGKIDEGGGEGPKIETFADTSVIQESVNNYLTELLNNPSTAKQKITRSAAGFEDVIGVFKVGTCGSYRELEIKMDCEDHKSVSRIIGDVGSSYVDGSGNVSFRFCLTEAGRYYYGGVLLIDNIGYSGIVLVRHHDTEDSSPANYYMLNNNNNKLEDLSGHFTKISKSDITLGWGFQFENDHWGSGQGPVSLGKYGTLVSNKKSTGSIIVDDEDSKNQNWIKQYHNNTFQDVVVSEGFYGILVGGNTEYFISTH